MQCDIVRRFIDDIMMIYTGNLEAAETIKNTMAEKFAQEGLKLTFRHAHSESSIKEVEFLDVNHVIDSSDTVGFYTTDFIKPTAIERVFLHGSSYHPISTFKSILKGECLRMRRLNERNEDFIESLERLRKKAMKSNFPRNLTNRITNTASTWKHRFPPSANEREEQKPKIIPWATAHPKLLQPSDRQRQLKPSATITFKKPSNLSTHLIHFRKLCHESKPIPNDTEPKSMGCGKCSLCGSWGKYKVNMVRECSTVYNKSTNKQYDLQKKLNCRNYGIYAACCNLCPAVYVGQTVTPFKDRWNGHRNAWNSKNLDVDNERNDKAALLKHYKNCHNNHMQKNNSISSAWQVIFLEEPSAPTLDKRETHWRDVLEVEVNVVNIQRMVWPRVK